MKKIILLYLLLLYSFFTYAQNILVQGVVQDSLTTPLPYTNVLLYPVLQDTLVNRSNLLDFTTTNKEGQFVFTIDPQLDYAVELTFVGYQQQLQLLTNLPATLDTFSLVIILKESQNLLNQVVIQEKKLGIQQKGDTLHYHIDQFTDQTEDDLADVLEKLPGFQVEENGTIYHHGKKVDELLVDGTPFFKGQHKVAGEQVQADMIAGVEVIAGYNGDGDIGKQDNSALNILIKEGVQGEWRGSVSLKGGFPASYETQVDAIRLSKQWKFNVILSADNVAASIISLSDYLNLKGGLLNALNENSGGFSSIHQLHLPTNLVTNDQYREQYSKSLIWNLAYTPTTGLSINAYGILTRKKQSANFFTQTDLLATNYRQQEHRETDMRQWLVLSGVQVSKRWAKKWRFSYQIDIDYWTGDEQANSVTQTSLGSDPVDLNIAFSDQQYTIQQQTKLTYQPTTKHTFSLNATQVYSNQTFDHALNTNQAFINPDSIFIQELQQDWIQPTQELVIKGKYKRKGKLIDMGVHVGGVWRKQRQTHTDRGGLNEMDGTASLLNRDYFLGLYVQNNEHKLRYKAGVHLHRLHIQELQTTEVDKYFLTPHAFLYYDFSKTSTLSLRYQLGQETNTISNIDTSLIFINPIQVQQGGVTPALVPTKQSVGLNYFFIDLFTSTTIILSTNYQQISQTIASNIIPQPYFQQQQIKRLPRSAQILTAYVLFSKTFDKLPLKLNAHVQYQYDTQFTLLENKLSKGQLQQVTHNWSLQSRLSIPFYASLSFQQTFQRYRDKNNLNSSTVNSLHIRLRLKGKINKQWHWKTQLMWQQIKGALATNKKWTIDGALNWTIPHSKWTVSIASKDIFNLKTTNRISATYSPEAITYQTFQQFPGYVMMGGKLKF